MRRLAVAPVLALFVAGCGIGDNADSTPASDPVQDGAAEALTPPSTTVYEESTESTATTYGEIGFGTSDPTSVGLPPMTAAFQERFDEFYRGVFLEDGYPARVTDNGIVAHPIYAVYVLHDYLEQLRTETGDDRDALQAGLRRVADAAVARMTPVGETDALGFFYEPEWELGARLFERHYSGLTQAYYSEQLQLVADELGDPAYEEAAARVFASLLVETKDGGVMTPSTAGPAFAELPSVPEAHVLNGWLSILDAMLAYSELREDDDIRAIVESSARRLLEVLPLYDAPEYGISRYGLTGFLRVKLVDLEGPTGVAIESGTVIVPGIEQVPVGFAHSDFASRWESFFYEEDLLDGAAGNAAVRANIVLSALSMPQSNEFVVETDATAGHEFRLEAQIGIYDPRYSGPTEPVWQALGSSAAGTTGTLTFDLPWDELGPVIFPTNFAKQIEGQSSNVYHMIHVKRLRDLGEALDIPEYETWAQKWESAVCTWDERDIYAGFSVTSRDITTPVETVDDVLLWCSG